MSPAPVILDTDIGTDVDDALALVLAARSSEVELVGVSTVCADVDLRARIARKLLLLLDRPDVPVAAGLPLPLLQRPRARPMGHEGVGLLLPGETVEGVSDSHAVDLIATTVASRPREVTLVCVGALSNAAAALLHHPDLARHLREVVVMGGAFHPVYLDDIEVPRHFETNFNNDPHAAEAVFRSGAPIRIVPAEVTFKAFLRRESVERLRAADTPLTRSLAIMCDIFREFLLGIYTSFGGSPERYADKSVLLHDPLALCALIRPDLLRFEEVRFDLERRDGHLVTERRPDGAYRAAVAVDADYSAFE